MDHRCNGEHGEVPNPLATDIRGGCGAFLALTFGRGLLRWLAPPRLQRRGIDFAVLDSGHLRASLCPSPQPSIGYSLHPKQVDTLRSVRYYQTRGICASQPLHPPPSHDHFPEDALANTTPESEGGCDRRMDTTIPPSRWPQYHSCFTVTADRRLAQWGSGLVTSGAWLVEDSTTWS